MGIKNKIILLTMSLIGILLFLIIILLLRGNNGSKVENRWEESDNWSVRNNIIHLNNNSENILIYKEEVDQDKAVISVEVMFEDHNSSAGIIFRNSDFNNKKKYKDFMIDIESNKSLVHNQQSNFKAEFSRQNNFEISVWYHLRVELNGHNARYYLDGELVEERSDVMVNKNLNKIALIANSSHVKFRNFEVNKSVDWDRSWYSIIKQASIEKHGYDRYKFSKYEYPYIGLAGSTLLISPYGFTSPDAPKKQIGLPADNHRLEGMFIYDYWWNGTEKEDPFSLTGGYYRDGAVVPGEIEGDNFHQALDISNGCTTTELVLNVNDEKVQSDRNVFVNKDGIVIFKVADQGAAGKFALKIGATSAKYALDYQMMNGCFVAVANLGRDEKAVIAIASNGEFDSVNNLLLFETAEELAELYIAPASTLNEKDAVVQAVKRAKKAKEDGYNNNLASVTDWWSKYYDKSSIDIPDLGMAKWYARTLFYNAVSIAGSRVPPGCYATNPEGFFGGICFEFDIMFSQLGLLAANRNGVTKSVTDWLYNIKPYVQQLSSNEYYQYPADSVKYAWIMGYDGTPVQDRSLEQGWRNDYPGANVAYVLLMQSLYTGEDIEAAKDILWRQTLAQVSHQKYFEEYDGYAHSGVWSPTSDDFNALHPGDFLQNVGLIWSIKNSQKYGVSRPEWDDMLPKILMPKVYDLTLGADVYVNSVLLGTDASPKGSGGPQFMPFFWLDIFEEKEDSFFPTFINIENSGNLNYNFNKGWASSVASKYNQSELALEMARLLLDPETCLYDDNTMVECVTDGEDFERAPHLGALGSYLMAVNDMLFDGYSDETITIFPAITEDWLVLGVSFEQMLANGQIEVSASYSEVSTDVKLKNLGGKDINRKVKVRVPAGSSVAHVEGAKYVSLQEGKFALVELTIPAGETKMIKVVGQKGSRKPDDFSAIFPADRAEGIKPDHVAFGFHHSNGAQCYQLIISESKDLSQPTIVKDLKEDTFIRKGIDLEEGKLYYWKVIAMNANGRTEMESGVRSFTTANK